MRNRLTTEDIFILSEKYKNIKEFRLKEKAAYRIAKKWDLLDSLYEKKKVEEF